MTPIVSIIVPCYNQAEYLSETLQSVLNQKFQDWECIIIDDGSPDNVADIAQEWSRRDQRFIFIHKENSGVSDTRNYAIKQAKGTFILPLDGDDLIESDFLLMAVSVFEEIPSVKLVYSNYSTFGSKVENVESPDFDYEKMLVENLIPNTAMYRKSDFIETQGYSINMAGGLEDWDFWLSFLKPEDRVVKLSGFYCRFRVKEISRSTLAVKRNEELLLQMFKNNTSLYLKYFNPIRDHINASYYEDLTLRLKKSPEYKLGRFLFSPFRFISKIVRRILK